MDQYFDQYLYWSKMVGPILFKILVQKLEYWLKNYLCPNGQRVVAVWVRFGVQLGLRQTPALIKSAKNTKKYKNTCSSLLLILRALNQCRCLPKAELNTKTNPNGHHSVAVWVRFGVQLDYSCRLKSVPSNGINRVVHLLIAP